MTEATEQRRGMDDYDMHLIRHIVGKALHDDPRFDPEDLTLEDIELALWASTADIKYELCITDPDERELFEEEQ